MATSISHRLLQSLILGITCPGVLTYLASLVQDRNEVVTAVTVDLALRIALPIVVCGIVTLIALCFLKFCYKPKVRVAASQPHPEWTKALLLDGFGTSGGFSGCSDGVAIYSANVVTRTRPRSFVTDAARWSFPLQGGRHVFRVEWPKSDRGIKATVGLGTLDTPLSIQRPRSLVGYLPTTWGLDIVRKRALHGDKVLAVCPTEGFVPDTFLVYVDLQLGQMGFGTDDIFWGYVIKDLPLDQPLYFMVAMTLTNATVQVFYMGRADPSVKVTDTSLNMVTSNTAFGSCAQVETGGPSNGPIPPAPVYKY